MATVSQLVVEISTNIQRLTSGLNSAQNGITKFVSSAAATFAKIGALAAAGISAAGYFISRSLGDAAQNVDNLYKASQRLSIPLKELQKIEFAGALSDVSIDTITRGLQLMTRNISSAAEAGGDAAISYNRLGLNLAALNKLPVDIQFRKIEQALKGVNSVGEKTKIIMDIFGRSGIEMLNLFNSNLKETDKRFEELGLGLSDAQGKAVESFNDSKTELGKIWESFKEQTVAAIAPAFEAINKHIADTIIEMGGIKGVANEAAKFIVDFGIKGLDAFQSLVLAGIKFGAVLDGIGVAVSSLEAGLTRVKTAFQNAASNSSITPPAIETGKNSNPAVGAFNALNRGGHALGNFAFDLLNPSESQLSKEAGIISPSIEKLEGSTKNLVETQEAFRENMSKLNTVLQSVQDKQISSSKTSEESTLAKKTIYQGAEAGVQSFSDRPINVYVDNSADQGQIIKTVVYSKENKDVIRQQSQGTTFDTATVDPRGR